MYIADAGVGRSPPQPLLEFVELRRTAASDQLDIAVLAVSHPAAYPEAKRDRFGRRTEKNTLHLTAHTKVRTDNPASLGHGNWMRAD